MSIEIDVVHVNDQGQVKPMYIVRGTTSATWKTFDPDSDTLWWNDFFYEGSGMPLFRSYEKALQALSLITNPL